MKMTLREIIEQEPESLKHGPASQSNYRRQTGKSLSELLVSDGRTGGKISLTELRAALWALLRHRHKRLTMEHVGHLLDDFIFEGGTTEEVTRAIIKQLTMASFRRK